MIDEKWLSVSEAAQLIGCTEHNVCLLARQKRLTAKKFGKRAWIIDKDSAVKFALEPQKTGRPRKIKKVG